MLLQNGIENKIIELDYDNTPRNATLVYTSNTHVVSHFRYIVGHVFSDQDGIQYVEFSRDGTNWYGQGECAYTGGDNKGYQVPVLGNYMRVRFVVGPVNQAVFDIVVNGAVK